jgi:hypothetical protein
MNPNDLRQHLVQLHAELGTAQRIDPGSQQLLGELMADIKRLTGESAGLPAATADAAAVPTLPDRLEKIAVLFEVDHPTLAASSRRLVDLLGKVGL